MSAETLSKHNASYVFIDLTDTGHVVYVVYKTNAPRRLPLNLGSSGLQKHASVSFFTACCL